MSRSLLLTPSSWLTAVLGLTCVVYGSARMLSVGHEAHRFVAVLGLDSGFLSLFGALECVLGLLLLSRSEVLLALACSAALQAVLLFAALSMLGGPSWRALAAIRGELFVAAGSGSAMRLGLGENAEEAAKAAARAAAWVGLPLLAILLERRFTPPPPPPQQRRLPIPAPKKRVP